MTAQVLRWGVLGATSYIATHVMPAVARTGGCRVHAVASRPGNAAAAAVAAEPYGATLHEGYEALLADDSIDVVYIALPNSDHVTWTTRALAAGKHVLLEKPMAMDEAGCQEIEVAAEASGKSVMEAFMYRFHPQQGVAAQVLRSGGIGELRVVRASFAYPIETGSGNIRLDASLGGGATWDVGCYAIDIPLHYFDADPAAVTATFYGRPGLAVETSAVATMDFGEGRSAVIDYSIDYGPRAAYELQGTQGTVTVRNAWAMSGEDGVVTVLTADGVREHVVPATDHYQLQVQHFAEVVRGERSAVVTLDGSRRTARVGAALVASAEAGGVAVPPSGAVSRR